MRKIIILASILLLGKLIVAQVITDQLVGYWSFDDAESNTAIDSFGNNGIVYNSAAVEGISGTAYSFSGLSNSYVRINNTSTYSFGTGDFSILCFIKTNLVHTDGNGKCILDKYYSSGLPWSIRLTPDGTVRVICDVSIYSTTVVNDNEWHSIAMVRENGTVRLYIDGVEEANSPSTGSATNSYAISVGKQTNNTYRMFFGSIDEVMIFNKGLSELEVYKIANETAPSVSSGESVWDTNGEKIYYNGGNVGIGIDDPAKSLHIVSGDVPKIFIEGTSATDPTLNFRMNDVQNGVTGWDIGDNVMKFKAGTSMNGAEGINIDPSNNIGLGTITIPAGYKLAVNGKIIATEIQVETGWADFVFQNDYKLMNLSDLENYINKNKHLPDIPSEAEVEENGISVGEMNAKLLQKIEELTLYIIEQQKTIDNLNQKVESQNQRLECLEEK